MKASAIRRSRIGACVLVCSTSVFACGGSILDNTLFVITAGVLVSDDGTVVGENFAAPGACRRPFGTVRCGGTPFYWRDGTGGFLETLGVWTHAGAINDRGVIVGASGVSNTVQHATRWVDSTVTDLGTLGGGLSYARAINTAGVVVGVSLDGAGRRRAFRWENGTMVDLGDLGGDFAEANDINDSGQIVGRSSTAAGGTLGFLWANGVLDTLGTFDGSADGLSNPGAINGAGTVAGTVVDASNEVRAVLWRGGAIEDLGHLGGFDMEVLALNDADQVIGYGTDGAGVRRPWFWSAGTLVTLGDANMTVAALNGQGRVVGWRSEGSVDQAFVWQDGVFTDLGTLGGLSSRALDVNEAGAVVGQSNLLEGDLRGFLWRDGSFRELSLR